MHTTAMDDTAPPHGETLLDQRPDACPKCGQHLDVHDRGAVDFYCPATEAPHDGD